MFTENSIINDRYQINRQVARGGMSVLYLATDLRLDDEIVLKVSVMHDDHNKAAFEREAKMLARLRHSGLPKVRDHFVHEGWQALIMEYIAGENLLETIESFAERGARGLPLPDVNEIVGQLQAILTYLHSQNPPIIHRDIKPANMKQMSDGQVVLLDFGLAKDSSVSLHAATMAYSPLEQINSQGTDARSDVYSLGATIYHLLTGERPIPATHRLSELTTLRTNVARQDPLLSIAKLKPELPPEISQAVSWAIQLQPEQRPANVAAFWEIWQLAVQGKPLPDNLFTPDILSGYAANDLLDSPRGQNLGETVAGLPPENLTQPLPQQSPPESAAQFAAKSGNPIKENSAADYGAADLQTLAASAGQFIPPNPAAPPPSETEMLARRSNRLGFFVVGGTAAILLLVGIVGLALWQTSQPSKTLAVADNAGADNVKNQAAAKPVQQTLAVQMYLKSKERGEIKVAPDYVFRPDDKMRFGLTGEKNGLLYIVARQASQTVGLLYPDPRIPQTLEPLVAKRELAHPLTGEIGFRAAENAQPGKPQTDLLYLVLAPNKDDELINEINRVLIGKSNLTATAPEVQSLLERLENLAGEARKTAETAPVKTFDQTSPSVFASATQTVVGRVELRSANQ